MKMLSYTRLYINIKIYIVNTAMRKDNNLEYNIKNMYDIISTNDGG